MGLAAALCALLAAAAPAAALSTGTAALPANTTIMRCHPDFAYNPYTVFTFTVPGGGDEDAVRIAAIEAAGFGRAADMSSGFINGDGSLSGTLYSEVWRDGDDDHLLFLYRFENTGVEPFEVMQVYDVLHAAEITDCGVIREAAAETFVHGDPLDIVRDTGSEIIQFDFSLGFPVVSPGRIELIATHEMTSWLYLETDVTSYSGGEACVQDGGSVDGIPTFVPLPEPLTMLAVFGGLLGLGGYIRRRRLA